MIATGEGDSPAWRVSVADIGIARTTFSSFPGLHRVFTVVGDHGVTLSWAGRTVDLDPLVPLPFDGELAPTCVASGPTSAFNVMVDAAVATARVEPLELSRSVVVTDPDATTVVYVHRGSVVSGDQTAGPGDCLVISRQSVEVSGGASLLRATIRSLTVNGIG